MAKRVPPWTKSEDATLRKHYATMGPAALSKKLHRTMSSVRCRAVLLGLTKVIEPGQLDHSILAQIDAVNKPPRRTPHEDRRRSRARQLAECLRHGATAIWFLLDQGWTEQAIGAITTESPEWFSFSSGYLSLTDAAITDLRIILEAPSPLMQARRAGMVARKCVGGG